MVFVPFFTSCGEDDLEDSKFRKMTVERNEFDKAKEMAKLIKHLWLGAYDEVCGEVFMKQYGPRIINLIGSSAVNPDSKTEVLGTADKGLKVTLYKINSLDKTNIELLNLYYFRTMHHEFAHILHQTKNYPTEFNEISVSNYSPTGWMNRTNEQAQRMGFVRMPIGTKYFVRLLLQIKKPKTNYRINRIPVPEMGKRSFFLS